jgi:hypothetical protein
MVLVSDPEEQAYKPSHNPVTNMKKIPGLSQDRGFCFTALYGFDTASLFSRPV